VKDGGDAADPLRGITVGAHPRFRTGDFHVETFGPHGPGNLPDPSKGGFNVEPYLVHSGNNHYLFGPKGHGAEPIPDTIHIDHLPFSRDGIGTANKAIASALLEADLQVLFFGKALLPVIVDCFFLGFQPLHDPQSPRCIRTPEPEGLIP